MAQQNKLRILARPFAIVLLLVTTNGFAIPIDKQLLINPIQICLSATVCANTQQLMPQDLMNTVWNQAGIGIEVLPFQSFVDPGSFALSFDEVKRETFFVENPTAVPSIWYDSTAPGKSSEQQIVNLWFIDEITGGFSNIAGVTDAQETVFNFQQWSQNFGLEGSEIEFFNNIVVTDLALVFGQTSLSYIISHEIGHALGLSHCDIGFFGSGVRCPTNANLMSVQNGGEQLGSEQVALARSSRFLSLVIAVPEPSAAYLLLPMLLFCRRQRIQD